MLLQHEMYGSQEPYPKLTEMFSNLLEKDAPMETKTVRENQAQS